MHAGIYINMTEQIQGSKRSMAILTLLFFMWGFITCLNDILIPHFKNSFSLSYFESSLVQFAFFGAYFIGSLIYFFISSSSGDPINRMGYRNGIIAGLFLSALGAVMFYPAAQFVSYGFFLAALFILGLGFTLLQIAANPYVAILGPAETSSNRLNLAQAFNSFGTTIAPLLGGVLILGAANSSEGVGTVRIPYLIFAGLFLALIVVFRFTHLPSFSNKEKVERGAPALRYPQLLFGIFAIFFYVGGEVSTGSFLTSYAGLPSIGGYNPAQATAFVALYWGSLMIGRFTGAIRMFRITNVSKNFLIVAVPFIAFAFILSMIAWKGQSIQDMIPYSMCITIGIIAFFIAGADASRTLIVFSIFSIILLVIALMSTGAIALWTVVSLGLYNSIMWPVIFTLAIRGLGPHTSQGSSLLVMAILGGALLPPLQGFLADKIGVHHSYIVPVISYLYLVFYGFKTRKIFRKIVVTA